jgi:hypothetical protein
VALGGFGFSGAGADQFRITSDVPDSVAPDSSVDVDVAFRPTIRDSVSAEFKFRADTPSDSVRTLSLSGTGEAGEVTASTTSLGFGSTLTETGLPVRKDVTITNDGNTTLTVSPQSASLEDAFSVLKGEQTIQPGNSETYTVEFDPGSSELPGRFTDVLEFETDDPFDETLSVSLNGTISQGELDVSPQSFDLGDVAVGNTESVSVVVGNTGTKTMENITARRDILRAVNGAASLTAGQRKRWELTFAHRRVQGVPRTRYSYPVGDSEVPCCFLSVSSPPPQGIPCEGRCRNPEIVRLSRHGGGRAASVGCATGRGRQKCTAVTQFTPGVNAGILSLTR